MESTTFTVVFAEQSIELQAPVFAQMLAEPEPVVIVVIRVTRVIEPCVSPHWIDVPLAGLIGGVSRTDKQADSR
jgi:hypothetical protein